MSETVGIIGRKVSMTHVFDAEGNSVPVTVVQAGPCPVVQLKKTDRDGYTALQLGYEVLPKRKVNKPAEGHFKRAGVTPMRYLQEFRTTNLDGFQVGQDLTVAQFQEGDRVDVRGIPIGKGFMGTTKRHHFGVGPRSHGSKSHRAPGSIGAGTTPSRVYKGQKMPGRRGHQFATVKNLCIVKVDSEKNLIFLHGPTPGPNGALVAIKPAVKVGK